jgi:two-component system chemotaxis sensor kinase CheA
MPPTGPAGGGCAAVEELGGSLALSTQAGLGTRFTIQLPLTLSIADALIVVVAGHVFAVPQGAVREVIEIQPDAVTVFENNEAVVYRDGVLPLVRLSAVFGLNEPTNRMISALVVGEGRSAVGIGIDRVLGLSEIVVRPLLDPLIRVPGIVGATELGDGRVVLILDTMALTRASRAQPHHRENLATARVAAVSAAPARVGT